MKKILALLLTAVLLFSLSACGGGEDQGPDREEEQLQEPDWVPIEPIINWDGEEEEVVEEPEVEPFPMTLEQARDRLRPDAAGTVAISAPEDLVALSVLVSSGDTGHYDQTFVMQNDIDLEGIAFSPIGGGTSRDGMPMFGGVFDGGNHVVYNLTIVSGSANFEGTGMFGAVGPGGEVRNLHLIRGMVYGGDVTGGIAGYNGGHLSNCSFGGDIITRGLYVGGLCGLLEGAEASIVGCFSNTQLRGTVYAGSFIGFVGTGSAVRNCYALGTITAVAGAEVDSPTQIGGFIGRQDNGVVENCYASTEVYTKVPSEIVGGFIGYNAGSPSGCYYNEAATENWRAVGANFEDMEYDVTGCAGAELTERATFTGWDFDSVWGMREDRSRGMPHLQAAWDD